MKLSSRAEQRSTQCFSMQMLIAHDLDASATSVIHFYSRTLVIREYKMNMRAKPHSHEQLSSLILMSTYQASFS